MNEHKLISSLIVFGIVLLIITTIALIVAINDGLDDWYPPKNWLRRRIISWVIGTGIDVFIVWWVYWVTH